MGPPSSSSPLNPALATPRSISRTPGTGSSAIGRGRSETPFQVKAEPMDPPLSSVTPWDNLADDSHPLLECRERRVDYLQCLQ